MEDYNLKYKELKREFESYQNLAESEMQHLNYKNIKLENDINILSNIVEISKYINSYISNDNLVSMINDMIIGLLGVSHSTIYIKTNNKLIIKATNYIGVRIILTDEEKQKIKQEEEYLFNSENLLRSYKNGKIEIRSIIGMPIKIRDKFIGYIIVDHTRNGFLTKYHRKFLYAISNQIAIALENALLYKELQDKVKRDPLLSIYNRKYFLEKVNNITKENPKKEYAILMIDLDNFKRYNDTYGHQFGDQVLIETTRLINKNLDEDDIFARYGGEELIVFIGKVESEKYVYDSVERIRKLLENNIITKNGFSDKITASFGLAYSKKDGKNINSVIKVADKLLYKAKATGKNRVVISEFIR